MIPGQGRASAIVTFSEARVDPADAKKILRDLTDQTSPSSAQLALLDGGRSRSS